MDRRAILLAAAAVAVVRPTRAAPARARRVGILAGEEQPYWQQWIDARVQALRELGWTAESLHVVVRVPIGDDLDAAAAELVREGVDAILTDGTARTLALRRATHTIPIVTSVADPVVSGLAHSLRAPATNVTGLSQPATPEGVEKQFELLKAIVPGLARIGIFHYGGWNWPKAMTDGIWATARQQDLAAVDCSVHTPEDVARALEGLRGSPRGAAHVLNIGPELHRVVAKVALEMRLPAAFQEPEGVEAGGLLSYSFWFPQEAARFAATVDKVLRGMDPALIPFQRPVASLLVVNRATARAIGLEIPQSILLRADRVIG